MHCAERVTQLSDVLDDAEFDEQLPLSLQVKAGTHFTPIAVARIAAKLLAPRPEMTVLDVGAGAGKFCIEAARVVPSARFVGVEWRAHLVRIATRLARSAGVANAQFIHGDALELDWSAYGAFYFYNPFAEQFYERLFAIDDTIVLDPVNFALYVAAVSERLDRAPPGTRVVTYHGLGGPLPDGYELDERHKIGSDHLELWIKSAKTRVPK